MPVNIQHENKVQKLKDHKAMLQDSLNKANSELKKENPDERVTKKWKNKIEDLEAQMKTVDKQIEDANK